jgi:dephospho-CoA kinase
MLIGISGKSGSGKSTLAKRIGEIMTNSLVISIDDIGHEVLTLPEIINEIKDTFGDDITKNGYVDRKLLGDIVFNNRHEMDKLTDITWKGMQVIIDNILDNNKDKIIIIDWLLLPHTKYFKMCDLKILVDVPFEIRMERAMLRDGISEEKFRLRDSASIELIRDDFDIVVEDVLKEDVRKLVKLYE